jgi:PadR family transcriptional regulator PadR
MTRPVIETHNLTKSCNEALILSSLSGGPKHGYQLALDIEKRSAGTFKFNHGTLYPILHKLEKDGLIEGAWTAEDKGRKRKSYRLTGKGQRYAAEQLDAWQQFVDRFFDIVGDGEK